MAALPRILRFSSDTEPGITRRVRGKGFSYHDEAGKRLSCEKALARIQSLGIPPAWRDVWICASAHGHLQATGRDARDRKQYRYHPEWRAHRDALKFANLVEFGNALPALRARVARDLSREKTDKRFASAALVRLLDRASLRIGNPEYTRDNGSFGATTLRSKHMKLTDEGLKLTFTAKGGKRVRKQVNDRTLNRVLQAIDDLPGRRLFSYIDASGGIRDLDSADINAYLGDEQDFTAKTFRTWRGTVEAFTEACESEDPTLKSLSERAARALHNTPAICRSSYIHPKVVKLAEMDGRPRAKAIGKVEGERRDGLRAREAELLAFIS